MLPLEMRMLLQAQLAPPLRSLDRRTRQTPYHSSDVRSNPVVILDVAEALTSSIARGPQNIGEIKNPLSILRIVLEDFATSDISIF